MAFKKKYAKRSFKKKLSWSKRIKKPVLKRQTGSTVSNIKFANMNDSVMICKEIGGYSQRAFVRLRYCTTFKAAFSAGSLAVGNLVANGIITPDGATSVPGAGDWIGLGSTGSANKAPYLQFMVHTAKIKMISTQGNPATSSTLPGVAITVCPMPRNIAATSYAGTFDNLLGLPGCAGQKVLTASAASLSGGGSGVTSECAIRIRDIMGMSKADYASSKNTLGVYAGSYSANPSVAANFGVFFQLLNGSSDSALIIDSQIEMEYLVEFFARNMTDFGAPA